MFIYNDVFESEKDVYGMQKLSIGVFAEEDVHGHCPYCDNYIDGVTNIFGRIRCNVCGQILEADDFLDYDYDLDDMDIYDCFN